MKNTIHTAVCALLMTSAYSQNFNKIIGDDVKKAIGKDLKGYQVFSYPTDNFGLATCYEYSMKDRNSLCAMWTCIGMEQPTDKDLWLKFNGMADVGGGGQISLNNEVKTKLALEVVLPKIYDVLGLSTEISNDRVKNIDLKIGKAYVRKLVRDKIVHHLNSLKDTSSVKRAFNNGDLVLIIADCVIDNLEVTLTLDQNTTAEVEGKLGNEITSKVFSDLSATVSVERKAKGTYTFKITHPVIFARLAKKQPGAGVLGKEDFSDWKEKLLEEDPSALTNKKTTTK